MSNHKLKLSRLKGPKTCNLVSIHFHINILSTNLQNFINVCDNRGSPNKLQFTIKIQF